MAKKIVSEDLKEKRAELRAATKDAAAESAKKLKGGLDGFKQFVREQNVVGLAVGLVLGTSAGALVNSLINNIIMPPLGFLLGSADGLKGLKITLGETSTGEIAELCYGQFANDLVNFLVLAFVIYIVIKSLKLDIKK